MNTLHTVVLCSMSVVESDVGVEVTSLVILATSVVTLMVVVPSNSAIVVVSLLPDVKVMVVVPSNSAIVKVAQKGHVHYQFQHFQLPISIFPTTNFQFQYFSFPNWSFLITNFHISYFQFGIFLSPYLVNGVHFSTLSVVLVERRRV